MGQRSLNKTMLEWSIYRLEQEARLHWRRNRGPLEQSEAPDETSDAQIGLVNGVNGVPATGSSDSETAAAFWVAKLNNRDHRVRKEAVRVLSEMSDPLLAGYIAPPLVGLLQDENHAVRRAAMNSLVALQRAALRPLFEALTRDFHSIHLRAGAHYVLDALYNHGCLELAEIQVLHLLKGRSVPGLDAAQAANQALINR